MRFGITEGVGCGGHTELSLCPVAGGAGDCGWGCGGGGGWGCVCVCTLRRILSTDSSAGGGGGEATGNSSWICMSGPHVTWYGRSGICVAQFLFGLCRLIVDVVAVVKHGGRHVFSTPALLPVDIVYAPYAC